jgi:hypothetical protein
VAFEVAFPTCAGRTSRVVKPGSTERYEADFANVTLAEGKGTKGV